MFVCPWVCACNVVVESVCVCTRVCACTCSNGSSHVDDPNWSAVFDAERLNGFLISLSERGIPESVSAFLDRAYPVSAHAYPKHTRVAGTAARHEFLAAARCVSMSKSFGR